MSVSGKPSSGHLNSHGSGKIGVISLNDSDSPGRLTKAGTMQEFVSQSNIERFKRLISTTANPEQLSTLKELLRLEEAKNATLPEKQGRS
jgi:hypothetical protein